MLYISQINWSMGFALICKLYRLQCKVTTNCAENAELC